MCLDSGIRKEVAIANMCAQYAPTTKLVDGTNVSATHAPIGSYVDETPSSPASTKNEVINSHNQ